MRKVTLYHRMAEIDPTWWNRLAGKEILMSHGWMGILEQCLVGGDQPAYFVLQGDDGPSAAAVGFISTRKGPLLNLDDLLFGRMRRFANRIRISALPVLTCQTPMGCAQHLLFAPELAVEERRRQAAVLIEAMETHAARHGLAMAFRKVLPDEDVLISRLSSRGYRRSTELPVAFMDVAWNSFDEYLRDLGRTNRRLKRNIRWEINRNRRDGVVIERLATTRGQEGRLYELMAGNYARHNAAALPFGPSVLGLLEDNLARHTVVFAARKEGRIIGTSLFLRAEGVWRAMLVGIDHEHVGKDLTYFNIAYYRPLQDAMAEGARRIFYGNSMYALKVRRGCRLMPGHIFFRPHRQLNRLAAKPFFWLHRRWSDAKLPPPFRSRSGRQEGAHG